MVFPLRDIVRVIVTAYDHMSRYLVQPIVLCSKQRAFQVTYKKVESPISILEFVARYGFRFVRGAILTNVISTEELVGKLGESRRTDIVAALVRTKI